MEYPKIYNAKFSIYQLVDYSVSSSAVSSGSGAFQMPTHPAAAATLRGGGGRANLRNALATFSLFWHEASLG